MASKASRRAWRRIGLGVAILAAVLVAAAGLAQGEVAQKDGARLSFDVEFSPQALPRDRAVPISTTFSGEISAVNGATAPRVKRLSIAFNRRGVITARGLPVCLPSQLQSVSTAEALERCRPALLGRGHFAAYIDFPDGFAVRGPALAFNGRSGDRPAVLLHVNVRSPVQAALVLVMKISHPKEGQFGTVLSTTIPKLAGGAGYLTGIDLTLKRRFRVGGETRSFVSASCPAPAGFSLAVFTLARGSFEFEDGQRASVGLTRTCRVARSG